MQKSLNLKTLSIIFLALSCVGFIDALYLTAEHYIGGPIPCSIFKGCDIVTNSIYSNIGGIPIALIGAFYYLTLIILSVFYLDSKKTAFLKNATLLSIAGFLTSLGLVYLQIFTLRAICLYCMISATTSTLLFLLGIWIRISLKKQPAVIL